MNKNLFVLCVFPLLLSACALVLPVNNNSTRWMVDRSAAKATHVAKHAFDLVILPPDAAAVYNSSKMAWRLMPQQISWFRENQWAESPSQMLHPLLLSTFQDSHAFHAVLSPPFYNEHCLVLRSYVEEFLQDYSGKEALFRLQVRMSLSRPSDGKILRSALIRVQQPILERNARGGVLAANLATAQFLQKIRFLTIQSM